MARKKKSATATPAANKAEKQEAARKQALDLTLEQITQAFLDRSADAASAAKAKRDPGV